MPKIAATLAHVLRRVSAAAPDADLLRAYAAGGDPEAFKAIVARHGPLVLGVCRRVLGDGPAAEDAFQATFLVLARRAGEVRRPAALAAWLFGVARRVALKARTADRRRQRREARAGARQSRSAEPADELTARELLAALDEELARLPATHQEPLLLCYWQGLTQGQAARQLGLPAGAIKGRLERGRARLAERLRRRGFGPAALLLAPVATAIVPRELLARTAGLAVSPWSPTIPTAVVTLAAASSKLVPTIVLSTLLAGVGVAALAAGGGKPADLPKPAVPMAQAVGPAVDRYGDPMPPGVIARLGTIRLRQGSQVGRGFVARFSPDSRSVLTWNESALRLWDATTGKLRWQFETELSVENVAFAPNGDTIAVISGAGLILVDAATGKQRRVLAPNFRRWTGLAFSPDGRLLAAPPNPAQPTTGPTTVADPLALWDMATGTTFGTLETGGMMLYQLAFSPDGRTLTGYGAASPENRRKLKMITWDVASRAVRKTAEFEQHYNGRLSEDGRYIAAHGKPFTPQAGEIRLWDTATGTDLGPLSEPGGRAEGFAGKTLCVLHHGKNSEPSELVVWDMTTRKPTQRYPLRERAEEIQFAPDGRTFLSSIRGQVVMLWDAATGKRLLDFPGHDGRLTSLAFTAEGRSVISCGAGSVRVWDAVTGEQVHALAMRDAAYFSEPALSPDGREVLVNEMPAGGSSRMARFEFPSGAERPALSIPTPADSRPGDRIIALHPNYRPDGRSAVATLQVVYTIGPGLSHPAVRAPWHVWDLSTGQPTASHMVPDNEFIVSFSPDGGRLMTYAGEAADKPGVPVNPGDDPIPPEPMRMVLSLYDTLTGRRLIKMKQPDNWLYLHAFSHDGQTLVTLTFHSLKEGVYSLADTVTIRGWELRTGHERFHIDIKSTSLNSVPTAVTFAPNDRALCIARRDCRLQFFDTATGMELPGRSGFDPPVTHLAFRPDGKRLATGLEDGTALVWDIAEVRPDDRSSSRLEAPALDRFWASLAGDDAGRSHEAMWALVGAPEQAVEMFAARLRPATADSEDRLKRLVADLDSPQFRVREAAEHDLAREGDRAETVLRAALREAQSAEQRRRIEALLDAPPPIPSGDALRSLRAVEVLSHIVTPEARALLTKLANGDPAAHLTREAKASLERLGRQKE